MTGTVSADGGTLPRAALARQLVVTLVVFLFFVRGFSTALLYSLLPKLKALFSLNYAEAMLIQTSFFLGYLIFSLPAAWLLVRLGYHRAILLGIAIMVAGCFTFCLAAVTEVYSGFLAALFVVATGIILLQVATNPFITTLGTAQGAHSRLTLAQAFNSLGTMIAPLVGAWLILAPADASSVYAAVAMHVSDATALQLPFFVVAMLLLFAAGLFWKGRAEHDATRSTRASPAGLDLLKNGRFLFAAIAIFIYVGAEVSVGSILVSYLTLPSVLSASLARASELLSLYWGGAMLGRFLGSAVLRVVPPAPFLATCAIVAMLLALSSAFSSGVVAAACVIAIGLFNSIMFPTIFTIGISDLGDRTAEGSGILCMAIAGGAVVPMIAGLVADWQGLAAALLVPAVCYVGIAIYGVSAGRGPSIPGASTYSGKTWR